MKAEGCIEAWLAEMAARPAAVSPDLLARVEADAIRLLPFPPAPTRPVIARWPWRWPAASWPGVGAVAVCSGVLAVLVPWMVHDSGAALRAWESIEMWEWEASVHDGVFAGLSGA